MTNEQADLANELRSAPTFKWLPGMLRTVYSPGSPIHGHQEGYFTGGYVFDHDVPDLNDAATAGALLSLLPLHALRRQPTGWRVSYDTGWRVSYDTISGKNPGMASISACGGETLGEAAARVLLDLAEQMTPMETLQSSLKKS